MQIIIGINSRNKYYFFFVVKNGYNWSWFTFKKDIASTTSYTQKEWNNHNFFPRECRVIQLVKYTSLNLYL